MLSTNKEPDGNSLAVQSTKDKNHTYFPGASQLQGSTKSAANQHSQKKLRTNIDGLKFMSKDPNIQSIKSFLMKRSQNISTNESTSRNDNHTPDINSIKCSLHPGQLLSRNRKHDQSAFSGQFYQSSDQRMRAEQKQEFYSNPQNIETPLQNQKDLDSFDSKLGTSLLTFSNSLSNLPRQPLKVKDHLNKTLVRFENEYACGMNWTTHKKSVQPHVVVNKEFYSERLTEHPKYDKHQVNHQQQQLETSNFRSQEIIIDDSEHSQFY